MIEVRLVLDEIDYDLLAERLLPLAADKMEEKGGVLGLLGRNREGLGGVARHLLKTMSQEKRDELLLHSHLISEIVLRLPVEGVLSKSCSSFISKKVIWGRSVCLVRQPLDPSRAVQLRHTAVLQDIADRLTGHGRNDIKSRTAVLRTEHEPSLRCRRADCQLCLLLPVYTRSHLCDSEIQVI